MNIWENAVLTNKGNALLTKLLSGSTLNITKAMSGAGSVAADLLESQTAVTTPKQNLSFRSVSYPEDKKCEVTCYLTNDDVTVSYIATQIGVYAMDPDDGEILFLIAQAPSGKGTEIPTATESPGYTAEWAFTFTLSQAINVNITVDPSNTVTMRYLDQYIEEEIVEFTAEEIDAILGGEAIEMENFAQLYVDELPETGEESTIYLIPKADGEGEDRYYEYLYVGGRFELLGSSGSNASITATIEDDILKVR